MRLSEENENYLNQIIREASKQPELTFEGYKKAISQDQLLLQALSSLQLVYAALDEYEDPGIAEIADKFLTGWRNTKNLKLDKCALVALKMSSLILGKLILEHRLNQ